MALIGIDDAKEHLKVLHDDDDVMITALVNVVTDRLDGYYGRLGRALLTQTWRQDFVGWSDPMRLPLSPVQTITSVKYYDDDNVEQTWATENYRLIVDGQGPYVARLPDATWPTVGTREAPISITFVAGYGSSTSSVPSSILHAAKLDLTRLYDVLPDVERKQIDASYEALIERYWRPGY